MSCFNVEDYFTFIDQLTYLTILNRYILSAFPQNVFRHSNLRQLRGSYTAIQIRVASFFEVTGDTLKLFDPDQTRILFQWWRHSSDHFAVQTALTITPLLNNSRRQFTSLIVFLVLCVQFHQRWVTPWSCSLFENVNLFTLRQKPCYVVWLWRISSLDWLFFHCLQLISWWLS